MKHPMFQRQRHLFGTTLRMPPKDADSVSHRLLTQGGFVHQLASGIFSLLPLGVLVHRRIETMIREEMSLLGAQEVLLPALQPRSLWEETGRWATIDPPLFIVTDRHDRRYALGPTHEEVVTHLARTYLQSYRQLPVAVYQLQTKFRNEQRATGGLLRVREFVMKDLYSFHASLEDQERFYEEVKQAYRRLFQRCGLEVIPVAADSGSIGGAVSHEFALVAETGEDIVATCPACPFGAKKETIGAEMTTCPRCGTALVFRSCIENGHIFQLGVKYSKAMGARFTTGEGTSEFFVMGCYGIGVGRLLAAIVEASHDAQGISWPPSEAPYDVHVHSLRGGETAENIARLLQEDGFRVLFDDREELSAGEKFRDSELIGIPVQVIVSERGIAAGHGEVRPRADLHAAVTFALGDIPGLKAHIQSHLTHV